MGQAHGSEHNIDILIDLLQAVLDLPPEDYESVTLVDPHLSRQNADDKLAVLDVKVKTKTGKSIDIEIQLCNERGLRERIVYYTSKMITEQLGEGDAYKDIKKVVTIVITDFVLIKDSLARHNCYQLHDKSTGSTLSDIEEIHTLELTKAPGEDEREGLTDWMSFFKAKNEEEYMEAALSNVKIQKAVVILKELSEDERTRMLADEKEKARRDRQAREEYVFDEGMEQGLAQGMERGLSQGIQQGLEQGMERGVQQGMERGLMQGRDEGLAQGLEQGIRQGVMENARRMKGLGVAAEDIAAFTGLAPEQIAAL